MSEMMKDDINPVGCVALLALVVTLWALFAWIGMLLWNWICAETFGWPALTFWKMAGLILLVGILCGGISRACSRS